MKIAEVKKINKAVPGYSFIDLYFKAEDFTSVAAERDSKTNNNSENKKLRVIGPFLFCCINFF